MNAEKKMPHIVLADDDANECLLFENALIDLQLPYSFSLAINGEMLLSMLDELDFNPDVIFLDLQKPGISGKDCLEVIKTRNKLKAVPIILYSPSVNPEDKDYCYNTRANEYFLKALYFLL